MPQVDYSKIVIYKIQHKEKDELLYVGSTTHFGNRKTQHKSRCYSPNGRGYNLKLYQTIRDNGGWDCFNMVVIKEFPCKNKQEALTEEDRIIREWRSSLNMRKAYETPEERQKRIKEYIEKNRDKIVEYKKEYDKEYYEQNRKKIIEYKKKYRVENQDMFKDYNKELYEKNREKILERTKEHYQQNREKIIDYNKEYREQNKIKIKERDNAKHECPCGGKYTRGNKAVHLKTNKHQTFLNQQTEQ